MKNILTYTILFILSSGIHSETPHLNYRYSSFSVHNPNEAITFLSKYIKGSILKQEEILIQSLSTNPEESEIQGFRIPYNQGTTFADIYFVKETSLPENPDLPLDDFIQKLQLAHTFSQVNELKIGQFHSIFHCTFIGLSTEIFP